MNKKSNSIFFRGSFLLLSTFNFTDFRANDPTSFANEINNKIEAAGNKFKEKIKKSANSSSARSSDLHDEEEAKRKIQEQAEKDLAKANYKPWIWDPARLSWKPKDKYDFFQLPGHVGYLPRGLARKIITLENYIKYREFAGRFELANEWNNGIILHGPPGSGKTSLIERITEYLGADGKIISFKEINSHFIGHSAKKLTEEFNEAWKEAFKKGSRIYILGIDEIEHIVSKRADTSEHENRNSENDKNVGVLLGQLADPEQNSVYFAHKKQLKEQHSNLIASYCKKHENSGKNEEELISEAERLYPFHEYVTYKLPILIVIGTTNRFKHIDPAITRDGRLGEHYFIAPMKNEAGKQLLAQVRANKIKLTAEQENLILKKIAPRFPENTTIPQIKTALKAAIDEAFLQSDCQTKLPDTDTFLSLLGKQADIVYQEQNGDRWKRRVALIKTMGICGGIGAFVGFYKELEAHAYHHREFNLLSIPIGFALGAAVPIVGLPTLTYLEGLTKDMGYDSHLAREALSLASGAGSLGTLMATVAMPPSPVAPRSAAQPRARRARRRNAQLPLDLNGRFYGWNMRSRSQPPPGAD